MSDTAIQSYMTDAVGPLPFCPGCGHDRLLKDLDRALVELQPAPNEVVIVTDIGCIGLADRYFVTNAFHGLHGRSLTYATGLKLARPELTVIVLIGDGGCGIGGTHLLNAARRNLDLTLIVANNFNYGMTGGQHSVTTPAGSRTATTPAGNIEGAMDICATAIGAGAGWAFRGIGYDKDLSERIVEAICHPGFALLDVWELCTAYYLPNNEFNKRELYALAERTGMQVGQLAARPRPEFGAEYRRQAAEGRKRDRSVVIEPEFAHALDRQTGIVIAGSAGQKVRSTATGFARAGMLSGLQATQKDDYPITIMTGHSVSEINLSPEPIAYTAIDAPDYFLVLSEDGLKKTKAWIGKLAPTCTLIADEGLTLPETAARVVSLPLAKTAREVDRLSIGVVALAAMLRMAGLFPLPAFETAIQRYQRAAVAKTNLAALAKGAALVA
ncbi:MAG: thiamine pyrophosphate-dependent enzyme [Alphaproteobacteria bacterium]|nr:thiamine pyrophosphate-dependent enzyme [Alphaproteobacteria bacterium]